MDFQSKIKWYIDAGFPILYLNTYEESKAEMAVKTAARGAAILAWDGTDRVYDISSEQVSIKYETVYTPFSEFLDDRLTYQKRQILILKNIDTFIHDPAVLARLKKIQL